MTSSWTGGPKGPGIIFGYGNVGEASFEERVIAASAAGFAEIGYSVLEFQQVKQQGVSAIDLARVAASHGVRVTELEIGLGFDGEFNDSTEPVAPSRWGPADFPWDVPYLNRQTEDDLLALGEAFGSNHIVVAGAWADAGADSSERFAALCDRAATVGLAVAIEFMPGTSQPDVGSALRVVLEADRPNGGLCVDNWHHIRGNLDDETLFSVPPERVIVIQLSDGPVTPRRGTYFEETLNHRRLFGDGEWDLAGFLDSLWTAGVIAPISLEVLSSEWKARPLSEMATSFHDAATRLVDKAMAL